MQMLAYVLVGFAPGLFWLWFFHRKDDLEPEPRSLVLRVFALGAGSALAVLALRPHYGPLLLDDLLASERPAVRAAVDAFVVTAGFEELLKTAAFLLGAYWHRELDEPLDGIVYGIAAALGFASVENAIYVIRADDASVAVLRAFTATLGHVAFTGSIGFFFGLAKFDPRAGRRLLLRATGLAAGVFFHGLYDHFLFLGGGERWISLVCVLPLLLVLLARKIRWTRALSLRFHPRAEE